MERPGSAERLWAVGCVLLVTACAGASLPEPIRPGGAEVLPGFDTRAYPGDEAMRTWLETSPYRWVGYYLSAPCYTGTTWVGRRDELEAIGWGVAAVFIGEQDWAEVEAADSTVAEQGARCTTRNLTAEQGTIDGASADSVMDAEGFLPGTPVFLDVERMERVSTPMETYVRAWFTELLDRGRYTPALYVHERNATPLYEVARAAFAAAGRSDAPILWVARSGGFGIDSRPSDSGILSAAIWQGVFDTQETWGGVTLTIDANVALTGVPGIIPQR